MPAFLSNAASCTFLNTISQVSIDALRDKVTKRRRKKERKRREYKGERGSER